jgi:4a-hydroxytetrahydrobiopterin dehydratase
MGLSDKTCGPCRGGVPPLEADAVERFHAEIPAWTVVRGHHLERTYETPDFKSALALLDRFGALAEEQGHHPDLHLTWGKVRVEIWTHAIDGLTENDFIFAAKCDSLAKA